MNPQHGMMSEPNVHEILRTTNMAVSACMLEAHSRVSASLQLQNLTSKSSTDYSIQAHCDTCTCTCMCILRIRYVNTSIMRVSVFCSKLTFSCETTQMLHSYRINVWRLLIDKLIIIQRAVINYDIIPSRLASRKMIVYERAVTSQLRSSTYRRVQSWPLSSPSMR